MSGDWRDMTISEILSTPDVFQDLTVAVARNANDIRFLLDWVEGWFA